MQGVKLVKPNLKNFIGANGQQLRIKHAYGDGPCARSTNNKARKYSPKKRSPAGKILKILTKNKIYDLTKVFCNTKFWIALSFEFLVNNFRFFSFFFSFPKSIFFLFTGSQNVSPKRCLLESPPTSKGNSPIGVALAGVLSAPNSN